MPRYIALLRAINVGGHTVKMDRLRQLFKDMGLSQVETYIASGNVIFDSPAEDTRSLERTIEAHLQGALGYKVATFLRTTSELAAIAAYGPFNESDLRAAGASLYIGFVADRPGDGEISGLQAYATESDAFHVHEREIYWLCRTRMSDSKFSGAVLEKTLGMPATLRNANTLRKIVAKYG